MHEIPLQRVAAIHDLSGFGRASLTVVIPILASMGVQTCPPAHGGPVFPDLRRGGLHLS